MSLITKTIDPIIETITIDNEPQQKVIGTMVEYKLLGMTICRKRLITPEKYGMIDWRYFTDI